MELAALDEADASQPHDGQRSPVGPRHRSWSAGRPSHRPTTSAERPVRPHRKHAEMIRPTQADAIAAIVAADGKTCPSTSPSNSCQCATDAPSSRPAAAVVLRLRRPQAGACETSTASQEHPRLKPPRPHARPASTRNGWRGPLPERILRANAASSGRGRAFVCSRRPATERGWPIVPARPQIEAVDGPRVLLWCNCNKVPRLVAPGAGSSVVGGVNAAIHATSSSGAGVGGLLAGGRRPPTRKRKIYRRPVLQSREVLDRLNLRMAWNVNVTGGRPPRR